MHTLNRILTALFAVIVLLPPATFAFVSLDERNQAEESLQNAIQTAVYSYRQRGSVQSVLLKNQDIQQKGQATLDALEARKRDLRHKILSQRYVIAYVSKHYNVALTGSGQIALLIDAEKRRLVRQVRLKYAQQALTSISVSKQIIVNSVLSASTETSAVLSSVDVQSVQMRFIADLTDAERAFMVLPKLEKQRDDVLQQYLAASQQTNDAQKIVAHSDGELSEIQRITRDVHDSVLKIQGDLARIDARLKGQAERALLAKGLIDPSMLSAAHTIANTVSFIWPVNGHVSAGFMDADYKKHFGVPHLGMDIVVPQGSAVHSAADGIVFMVRDGGLTGYSYILVGHRNGYATLYGHVSQALVSAGQEVTAGQEIALSGGTPGMHGSGPMTTAAHLHFEVIQAGVNINPGSVLP